MPPNDLHDAVRDKGFLSVDDVRMAAHTELLLRRCGSDQRAGPLEAGLFMIGDAWHACVVKAYPFGDVVMARNFHGDLAGARDWLRGHGWTTIKNFGNLPRSQNDAPHHERP